MTPVCAPFSVKTPTLPTNHSLTFPRGRRRCLRRPLSSGRQNAPRPLVTPSSLPHPWRPSRHFPGALRLLTAEQLEAGRSYTPAGRWRTPGRPALPPGPGEGSLFRGSPRPLRPRRGRPGEILCLVQRYSLRGVPMPSAWLHWLTPPNVAAPGFPRWLGRFLASLEAQQRAFDHYLWRQQWLAGFVEGVGLFKPWPTPDNPRPEAMQILLGNGEEPLLRELQRWLGGEVTEQMTRKKTPSGHLLFRLENPRSLALLLLHLERFTANVGPRHRLAKLGLFLLGRSLLPLAPSRQLWGTSAEPSPVLLGLWEAAGNLRLRRDHRWGWDRDRRRLAGFSLAVSGLSKESLDGFLHCWGGTLHPFPPGEPEFYYSWLWYVDEEAALEAFFAHYRSHPERFLSEQAHRRLSLVPALRDLSRRKAEYPGSPDHRQWAKALARWQPDSYEDIFLAPGDVLVPWK